MFKIRMLIVKLTVNSLSLWRRRKIYMIKWFCRWRKLVWILVNLSGQVLILFLHGQVDSISYIYFLHNQWKADRFFSIHTAFPSQVFARFLLFSGLGCHYLHLHKGECQTDQYLEGCRVYKPLKNGVSFISSLVILSKTTVTKQYPSYYVKNF